MNGSEKIEMLFLHEDDSEALVNEYLRQAETDDDHLVGFQIENNNHRLVFRPESSNTSNDGTIAPGISTALPDVIGDTCMKSGPLGLKLTITPSFINLLEATLSTDRQSLSLEQNRSQRSNTNNSGPSMSTNLKASNFPMASIVIGQWQRFSMHDKDLIAKLYYAKKKIVWEILEGGLKNKIEILWSEISAMKTTTMQHDQLVVLEIELDRPPIFYREAHPEPRKHTIWNRSSDFTGGQASCFRKHVASFSPGVFNNHYEKLLRCDLRLLRLSHNPFPSHGLPYFNSANTNNYMSQQPRPTTLGIESPFTLTPNPSARDFRYTNNNNAINVRVPTFWDQQTNFPIGNTHHAQGSSTYVEDNRTCNKPCNYGPSTMSLADIEHHLLGDSEPVLSYDGTLQAQVQTMCSLLVHESQVMQNPTDDILLLQDFCTTQPINNTLETMAPTDNVLDPFTPPGGVTHGDPSSMLYDLSDIWK